MFPKNKKSYFVIGTIGIAVLAGILFFENDSKTPEIQAASTENIMGFAWSQNIGWISFNSLNCDLNNDGFYNDGGANGCLNDNSAVIDYGVNLNADNTLSGYAWSENIGWISFDKNITSNPPRSPYNGAETYIAKYDPVNYEFSGWARALSACQDDLWDSVNEKCLGSGAGNRSGGWDGWIKLRKDASDLPPNYGVSLNGNDFEGFAWGDMVVGWVSFNSKNCDTDNNTFVDVGACGGDNVTTPVFNYRVYPGNNPPTVSDLAIFTDYCTDGLDSIKFIWSFDDIDGDSQSAYKIDLARGDDGAICSITENNNDFFINAAEINQTCPGFIGYNHTDYTWSITVWDSGGLSDTTSYAGPPFDTPDHEYPIADFGYTPSSPLQFQDVDFDPSASTVASGYSIAKWVWNFGDSSPLETINNPPALTGDTSHIFSGAGSFTVDLEITDSSAYSCWASDRGQKSIDVELNKPVWNEVEPKS